jgi:4-amino-4-deoxy-L-arabinose transferase-like glycosyltransferase
LNDVHVPSHRGPLGSNYLNKLLAIIFVVTLARILTLAASELNFHGDEAQYWTWSQQLDWGYYTKPPMIAWIISLTTTLLGDAEWSARISSPILHGGTSFCCALIADKLYGKAAAFWAGITFLTLPAVSFSSCIISTDVPLLFFWSASLYVLIQNLESRSYAWSALLGITIGLGLLSKYAMAYFFICTLISCCFSKEHRWFLKSSQALLSLAIAAVIISPNVFWNMNQDWVTVTHVGDNINLKGELFNYHQMISFLGEQFGVFGPILFCILIWIIISLLRNKIERKETWLLSFVLPILIIVTVQAFISRANANWAATAYIGGTILVTGWITISGRKWVLKASLCLHFLTMLIIIFYSLGLPGFYPPLKSDPLRKLRGWTETAQKISAVMKTYPDHILLTDDRKTMASLLYGLRDTAYKPQIWDYDGHPDHHYELTLRYIPRTGDKILLAAKWKDPNPILSKFSNVKRIGNVNVAIGENRTRTLYLFELKNYQSQP